MNPISKSLVWLILNAAVAMPTAAQTAVKPALTVVGFSGAIPTEAGDSAADDLAARLVSSGHYRVLDRAWLPIARGQVRVASLEALRHGALQADVDYLVLGSVIRSEMVAGGPAATAGPQRAGWIGALPRGPRPPVMLPPPRSGRGRQVRTTLRVRVVEVRGGAIVRETMAESGGSSSALWPVPMLRGPLGPVLALAAIKANHSRIDSGLEHAISEVTKALTSSPLRPIDPDAGPVPPADVMRRLR